MKAALLVESLTGNTWKAAERIADDLTQEGWSITGLTKVRQPDLAAIQDADIVLVGTWVHGLFVVGQTPWALARSPTCRPCAASRRRCSARSPSTPARASTS